MLLMLLACVELPIEPAPPGTETPEPGWYSLPELPHPIQEHGVVQVAGEVWVVGGVDDQIRTLDEVWIFDGDSWRAGPSLPVALHHPDVAVLGDAVYVLGGLSGASFTPTALAWMLAPGASEWTELPDLPSPRGAAATMTRYGTEIVLAGGLDADGTTWSAVVFDTRTLGWRILPSLPEARDHAAGLTLNGEAYVFGGRDSGLSNVRDDVWWATADVSWEPETTMQVARAGMAATVIDGDVAVLAGGEGNPEHPDGVFDTVEVYRDGQWELGPPMVVPIHGAGAAPFRGGVIVPGGADVLGFRATSRVQWLVLD